MPPGVPLVITIGASAIFLITWIFLLVTTNEISNSLKEILRILKEPDDQNKTWMHLLP